MFPLNQATQLHFHLFEYDKAEMTDTSFCRIPSSSSQQHTPALFPHMQSVLVCFFPCHTNTQFILVQWCLEEEYFWDVEPAMIGMQLAFQAIKKTCRHKCDTCDSVNLFVVYYVFMLRWYKRCMSLVFTVLFTFRKVWGNILPSKT